MDQFEIGGVSAFGGPETEPLTIANFDPGSFDIRKQETDLPRGDGVLVGSEYLGGGLWSFDLNAHGSTRAEVLTAAGELQRVWNDPARRVAGAVSVLRYQIDGRWRRVYGRPGRFAAPRPDYAAQAGIGSFGCDFRITRPAFYEDVEQQDVVFALRGRRSTKTSSNRTSSVSPRLRVAVLLSPSRRRSRPRSPQLRGPEC